MGKGLRLVCNFTALRMCLLLLIHEVYMKQVFFSGAFDCRPVFSVIPFCHCSHLDCRSSLFTFQADDFRRPKGRCEWNAITKASADCPYIFWIIYKRFELRVKPMNLCTSSPHWLSNMLLSDSWLKVIWVAKRPSGNWQTVAETILF